MALRLRAVVRSCDVLSRFGGDEFCIMITDVHDPASLQVLGARIHLALGEPFHIEGQSVSLRTSIGIAISHPEGEDPDTLVCRADAALYDAKRAGRGVTRLAGAIEPGDLPGGTGRGGMEALLRQALLPPGHEPFALAVQPIFQGESGQLAGFEALVRWPGPDGRIRQPAEFVPVAESTGLVAHLDRWVLNQACSLAAGWPSHLQVSSNLSAANFFTGDLVAEVQAALDRHGLAPDRLRLEITETVLLCDPDRVRRIIADLRDRGVHIVLDDFGVGHASIAYLRDFAFDGVKIDRSFVAGLETDPKSRAFMRAIIEMTRALGVEATAEGVETDGQLRALRHEGVANVQGYLLGRPMSPEAAALLIQQPSPVPARTCTQTAVGRAPF